MRRHLLPLLLTISATLAACGQVEDATSSQTIDSPRATTTTSVVADDATNVSPTSQTTLRLEQSLADTTTPDSTEVATPPDDDEASIADLDLLSATPVDKSATSTPTSSTTISSRLTTTTLVPTSTTTSQPAATTSTAPAATTTTTDAVSATTTTLAAEATDQQATDQQATTSTSATPQTTTTTVAEPAPVAAPAAQHSSTGVAEVATVTADQISVFPTPTATTPEWSFDRTTQFGTTTVFLIAGRDASRLKVLLPIRQKHTYGWINASDVGVSTTDLRAVISLKTRDVALYRGNQLVSSTTAVIGKASTPTPLGSFFVTDKLRHANPAGGYGPWIVALSARSEALTTFNGGEPLIAIHGTNKPWLVGGNHSNGCIRLPNDAITALAEIVPLGTPVDIVA